VFILGFRKLKFVISSVDRFRSHFSGIEKKNGRRTQMSGTVLLRQQLQFLWQPYHAEYVLKVLPRFPAQGAAIFQRKDGFESVSRSATSFGGDFSVIAFFCFGSRSGFKGGS